MKIAVAGKSYENFIEARVRSSLTSITREFELRAITGGINDIPFRPGQSAQVSDGDDTLVTGYIERVAMRSTSRGVEYSIAGRGLMGDLVDSNLPFVTDIDSTVAGVARFILEYLGIEADVIDEANTSSRPFKSGYSILAPDPADTALDFLSMVARRKRTLLTEDEFGNLVITNGNNSPIAAQLRNLKAPDDQANNLLTASFITDHSQRFGRYSTSMLQMNVAAAGKFKRSERAKNIVAPSAFYVDEAIRASRIKTVPDDFQLDPEDRLLRAKWEADLATSNAIKYVVTVPGFRHIPSGELWRVNSAPAVLDDFAGLYDRMLVSDISYSFNADGRTTEMTLTRQDAFSDELKIRREFEIDGVGANEA